MDLLHRMLLETFIKVLESLSINCEMLARSLIHDLNLTIGEEGEGHGTTTEFRGEGEVEVVKEICSI